MTNPDLSFADRSVVVTGASSGIGRATALAFARAGGAVVLVGRQEQALEAVRHAIQQDGGRAALVVADVTAAEAPARIVGDAVAAFGAVDVLVNAAGVIASGSVESTSDHAWDAMLDVNLRATFRLMRAAAPQLALRRGAIVNVSSVAGLRAFPGLLAYAVSKAAVDQLTRCAALDLAPSGVRVNAVNPGVVVTELHRRSGMADDQYAAFLERSQGTHPLGRVGRPEEIAGLVLFLASDRAGWMTGETIAIDGGRHLTCAR
ncbi:MAG: glucose 1-dehydrogenase [Acidobacteriota bacterium]|nr:glucose 1-dehydrogenase [Acidobacteriota bacterium]